jgi:hypothetical protein
MIVQHIKPTLLLIVLVAPATASCNIRSPSPQSSVYILDSEKQLDPLLLHEFQSLHVPSADAAFQIVNVSSDSCSIIFEGVSCGCTSAEVDGKQLQFKDRFTISADGSACFKLTSRLPAKPGLFDFRANLTIMMPDGAQTEMSVHYGVRILADIVLTPDVLLHQFHSLDDESVIKTIHIERRWRGSRVPAAIPTLAHLPPQLKILQIAEDAPPAQIEPGIWSRSWNIRVSLSPSSDLQSNPVRSLIPISFPATPDLDPVSADLPVLVRLASGIEAPGFIHLGTVKLGERQTRRFLLRAADNVEFSVLSVHSTSPAFSVSKPSLIQSRSCWLELTFQANEPGNHCANIVIETNHPRTPQVSISVRGTGSNAEKND